MFKQDVKDMENHVNKTFSGFQEKEKRLLILDIHFYDWILQHS